MKLLAVAAGPDGVVTVIGPDAAPEGTCATISVAETLTDLADAPPNLTEVVPDRPVPCRMISSPLSPRGGVAVRVPVWLGVASGSTARLVAAVLMVVPGLGPGAAAGDRVALLVAGAASAENVPVARTVPKAMTTTVARRAIMVSPSLLPERSHQA